MSKLTANLSTEDRKMLNKILPYSLRAPVVRSSRVPTAGFIR